MAPESQPPSKAELSIAPASPSSSDDNQRAAGASGLPGAPRWNDVVDDRGEPWLKFRKTLTPRYGVVWRDIALGYVMVIVGWGLLAWLGVRFGQGWALALLPLFALWLGYWLHAVSLFGHEAAHYNLAADRKPNDWLADWLVWPLFAQNTADYRKVHWQHHLHLGDHDDTEISYHHCLSPWFLTQTLTGIYLVRMVVKFVSHAGKAKSESSDDGAPDRTGPFGPPAKRVNLARYFPLLRTALLHAAITFVPVFLGWYAVAVAWVLAALVVFPFFASIRQILEHRRLEATCDQDFTKLQHGPVNRLFGTGLFSRFFGAAGFNRHLFHHWDPTVSYTRFDDMEAYLARAPLGAQVQASKATYIRAFVSMVRSARHG